MCAQLETVMWNHFDNDDERTNNRVEGDNGKMRLYCGASDPNIDKASDLLRQYESTARDKYVNAKKVNAKAPVQKDEDRARNIKFKTARNFYKEGKLSFKNYYESILSIHEFAPKKKYVEELEDTDDSDAISDNSDDENESAIHNITSGVEALLNSVSTTQPNEIACEFCTKIYKKRGLGRHQLYCKNNPNNIANKK